MVVLDSDSTIANGEEVAEPLSRTPVALSVNLIEREKIQCRYATSTVSPPPNTPWSMVAVRDYGDDNNNSTIIFPPINQENIQISKEIMQVHGELSITSPPCNDENSESDSDANSNSSATFSPSDSSAESASPSILSPKARSAADIALWLDSMVEILRSKVNNTATLIWSNLASTLKSSLTLRYTTVAAMLLLFLYFRRRRIFRSQEDSTNQLIRVVKERDEKINKLLDQIAECVAELAKGGRLKNWVFLQPGFNPHLRYPPSLWGRFIRLVWFAGIASGLRFTQCALVVELRQ